MPGKIKNYFVRANSSQGMINLLYTNVIGMKTGIILTGSFEILKQELLASTTLFLSGSRVNIECIHSCYDPDALEGIIIRDISIGIFSDVSTNPRVLELFDNTIKVDMNQALNGYYAEIKEYLLGYKDECDKNYEKAYEEFAKAILIHDEWEKVYIDHMHFDKANAYAGEVIAGLFNETPAHKDGIARHRFFGVQTCKGSFDFVMDLTKSLGSRYFIKGRPGSGKSTFMKKIQTKAEELKYEVEVYHCGFHPNSLDMIIIEDLDFCVFDSTAPHEYFPSTSNDYVLDMYAEFIDPDIDETYQSQLDEISARYKTALSNGTLYMQEGKAVENRMNRELNHYIREDILARKIVDVQQLLASLM